MGDITFINTLSVRFELMIPSQFQRFRGFYSKIAVIIIKEKSCASIASVLIK